MESSAFYAVVAGICFALIGLLWNVIGAREEWREDATMRGLLSAVYTSFLIPGVMSLGGQLGVSSPLMWQAVFVVAALAGIFVNVRFSRSGLKPIGPYGRNRWAVIVIYLAVLLFSVAPGLAKTLFDLAPLQVEGILVVLLLILAHGQAWELMMVAKKS
ncbi:MAG: hypothetical protein ACOYZ8_03605 [Chloroflexota bacterium]